MKKNRIKINKKPDGVVKKNDRLAFLANEFIGKERQEGSKNKYDFSVKDKDGKVLAGKFKKITKEDFELIVSADPSTNKQYSQWLLNIYAKGNLTLEDLYKATEDLSTLYKFKNKVEKDKRDITQFDDLDQLYEAIQKLSEMSETELLSQTQIAKKLKLDGAEVHLDSDNWRVLTPLNVEASRLYGAGTRWCTASSGYNQFDNYTKTRYPNSKLYIIINKKAPASDKTTNKFQWHFESKSYMNALDQSINWQNMLTENPELRDCFLALQDGNGLRLKLLFGIDLKPEEKIIKNGNLDWLREYLAEDLPSDLEIFGNVDLSDCRAKRVKNLTVHGNLTIKKSSITKIEGKLVVDGIFDAEDSNLEFLPDGTSVGDSMMLRNSKITRLPKHLKVGSHLFASYLKLSEVPSDLEVGQNLYLHGAGYNPEQFPSTVKVGSKIFASELKPIQ